MNRRHFLHTTAAALASATAGPTNLASAATPASEWRNKQGSMAYRRLVRTGMMILQHARRARPPTNRRWLIRATSDDR